jgi:hypothetical protein
MCPRFRNGTEPACHHCPLYTPQKAYRFLESPNSIKEWLDLILQNPEAVSKNFFARQPSIDIHYLRANTSVEKYLFINGDQLIKSSFSHRDEVYPTVEDLYWNRTRAAGL